MSLSSEYERQLGWRAWPVIFDALPPLDGQTVLDLGCGVGGQTAEFVARGARVIGVDMNGELLAEARSRGLANAEFRRGELRAPLDLTAEADSTCDLNPPEFPLDKGGGEVRPRHVPRNSSSIAVDGLWCSFTAAYFPDLSTALSLRARHLRPGGLVALTEIDDLFGHEPLGARTRSLLTAYAQDAFVAGRYDFHMGRKLREHLERCGFIVSKVLTLEDQELSFSGPARPEVVEAWRSRLDRMKLLVDFCEPDFEKLRTEFLSCLTRPDHHCEAKVYCCIGARSRSH